jgi:CIC family chloride channel protein
LLLIAGAAGGIGAIFRTPLGGALFVVEVLYSDDLEAEALVPAVLSSVVAYSIFTSIFGEGELFAMASNYHLDARELPLFAAMALCCGIVGAFFLQVHHKFHAFAKALPLWPPLIALFGGGLVGLLSLAHPAALGSGYGWMQEALEPTGLIPGGWLGVGTLLLIAFVKVFATSISTSTGAAGGVFGPSVVIGGMVGGAFGLACHQLFPHVVAEPSSYMLVGMACFIGGVTSSPISTLIMACEMTGSYELLVPTMLAEVVTFTVIRNVTLYEEQVPTRRDSPAHGGEYVLDILQDLRVRDVFVESDVVVVPRSLPLSRLLRQASESSQVVFPVSGEDGEINGLVTLDTIKAYHYDEDIGMLAIAADCESAFVSVSRNDSLALALEKMAVAHYGQLPVVRSDEDKTILGLITYDDLLQSYSRELRLRRRGGDDLAAEA